MKETILTFVGSYKEQDLIPGIKSAVKEFLGNRMIKTDSKESPVLELSMPLQSSDISAISGILSNMSDSISMLIIDKDEAFESFKSANILPLKVSVV